MLALGVLAILTVTGPAAPQYDFSDEPLLAAELSDKTIEMRGRWVRQWTDEQGELVLVYNGGFRLDMGDRRLSANNAVVWIEQASPDEKGRVYFTLTVYLAENAEVVEPSGTITQDNVLLVRGLRTRGEIVKYEDAHAPDNVESHPLYQEALRTRLAAESAVTSQPVITPEVTRPGEATPPPPPPRRVLRYRLPNIEPTETPDGQTVFVATGGVYFSEEGGPESAALEIRADNAVVFPTEASATGLVGKEVEGTVTKNPEPGKEPAVRKSPASQPASAPAEKRSPSGPDSESLLSGRGLQSRIQAVYLEGDVVLSLGTRFVRANRLYYDFERDRALILDGVFRVDLPERGIPLYVRANEIRQLSSNEFAAEHAIVTTSEFYTPSYHVGAERVYLRDLTARDEKGRSTGEFKGEYEMKDSTLNVEGIPIAWWPYSRGTFEASETLIRSFSTGYSSRRGYELETKWNLFNLLGLPKQEGYDPTLHMDYFSKRGPATGIDVDYQREKYYGLLRSYLIYDQGQDKLGPLRQSEEDPPNDLRGRVLWRHRHYLPYGWEATLEVSYISDRHFLEEWDKKEYQEGKEQETLVYLKRAKDVEAITFLANWRILDFLTQTEHLPDLGYRRIGDTWLDPIVLYHETHVGAVRYEPAEFDPKDLPYDIYQSKFSGTPFYGHNVKPTGVVFRTDVREEAELPLKLGPVNLVPFASIRGTYWGDQPYGDLWRGLGVYGVRGSTSFSRVYDDINSDLLDIHRIRHIIQPEFAAWGANSNVRSEYLTPFDYGIETIDGFYGVMGGVRQTWQTKRGLEEHRRTVDLLTLNLRLGLFGNTEGRHDFTNGYVDPIRPEDSRTRNYFAGDLAYRISDSTSLLYDFNYYLNDRSFDMQNVALTIERDPRLSYVIGARYAGEVDLSYVGGGFNYKMTEKHTAALRGWWDVESGQIGEVTFSWIRRLPRWYLGLNLGYDNVNDEFSISVSFWPEGVPEWALGSRRFTGLATSTGIRP